MKQKVFISLIALMALLLGKAAAQLPEHISDSAKIAVMTLGPSQQQVYLAFGHSAIRVLDYRTGADLVFNYGVFDFDQPNFYLNFTRGRLLYKLGVAPYRYFKEAYMEENRLIEEQELNLLPAEKQILYAFLYRNAQPENCDYYYNYTYNNCATKIRDVLEEVFGGHIAFDYSYVEEGVTFRQLMDKYLDQQPWGDFSIDVCLATGVDKVAAGREYMYLPDYVKKAVEKATITRDGKAVPLVKKTELVFSPQPAPSVATWLTPIILFAGLFLAIGFSTHQEWKAGERRKWLDLIVFLVPGVLGILLLLLWFGTDHISQHNYNLIWAFPLHVVVAFFSLSKSPPAWLAPYLASVAVVLGLLIVCWGMLPQQLHPAFVPIVLTVLLRAVYWRYWAKRLVKKREV